MFYFALLSSAYGLYNKVAPLFGAGKKNDLQRSARVAATAADVFAQRLEERLDTAGDLKVSELHSQSGQETSGAIEKYTEDMVDLANTGGLRGRVKVRQWLADLLKTLCSVNKGIFFIKGEPGTGKTVLVEDLAYAIANEEIPLLKGARLLRLKTEFYMSQEKPAKGMLQDVRRAVFGDTRNRFSQIIREIQNSIKTGDRRKYIIWIDEIHKLFEGNENFLLDFLPELDQAGISFVGATSQSTLIEKLKGAGQINGFPLARRLKVIHVPSMSPQEACQALADEALALSASFPQAKLTRDGAQAIVYLENPSSVETERGVGNHFPGKAIHFFEQVVAFTLNQRERPLGKGEMLEISESQVIEYLSKVSLKNPSVWKEKLCARLDLDTARKRFIEENIFVLKKGSEKLFFGKIEQLKWSLQDSFSRLAGRCVCISTNAQSCLEAALLKVELKAESFQKKNNREVWIIPADQIVLKIRNNPHLIPILEDLLNKIDGNTILLFREAELLLQHMRLIGKRKWIPTARNSLLQDLGPFGERVAGVAVQGAAFLQNHLNMDVAAESRREEESRAACPALLLLEEAVAKLKCVIEVPESVPLDAAALKDRGIGLETLFLTPSRLIEEISNQLDGKHIQWIKKLVFLSHFLPRPKHYAFQSDFCADVFERLRFEKKNEVALASGFADQESRSGRELEKCLDCLDALKRLGLGSKAKDSEKEDLKRDALATIFPSFFASIDEADGQDCSLLKIQDPDLAKAGYLASLAAEQISRSRRIPLLNFSRLLDTFPDTESQKLFVEVFLFAEKKAVVLVENLNSAATANPLFQELVQRKGVVLVQATACPIREEEQRDAARGLIQQGAHLLNQFMAPQNTNRVPEPSPLEEANSAAITHSPFTKEQFHAFISEAIPSDLSQEVAQALVSAYYFLHQAPHRVSLGRVRRLLSADLKRNLKNKEAVADCLFKLRVEPLGVNKQDFLHAVAPESSSFLYRLTQKVKRVFSAAIEWIYYPIQVVTSWFVGRVVVRGAGWVARSLIGLAFPRGFF